MIINENTKGVTIDGVFYAVGMKIKGQNCEYDGLIGYITEIRDGEDKDTDNDTVDIYCSFDTPTDIKQIKSLEKIFTELYDETKLIDDIILDCVILAPKMIAVIQGGNR